MLKFLLWNLDIEGDIKTFWQYIADDMVKFSPSLEFCGEVFAGCFDQKEMAIQMSSAVNYLNKWNVNMECHFFGAMGLLNAVPKRINIIIVNIEEKETLDTYKLSLLADFFQAVQQFHRGMLLLNIFASHHSFFPLDDVIMKLKRARCVEISVNTILNV